MKQNLFVQYGNPDTQKWETISNVPLRLQSELYPNLPTPPEGSYGLNDYPIRLPNGEDFLITVAYSESNLGISVRVFKGKQQLIFMGGFKSKEETYDPTIMFFTEGGRDVQIMVGPEQGLNIDLGDASRPSAG